MKLLLLATALLVAAPATAETSTLVTFPAIGVERTIPVGGEVYSYTRAYITDGAILEEEAKAGSWLLERKFAAGTQLVPVSTRAAFKACVPAPGTLEPSGPCFLDDNGDSVFDRHSGDSVEMARKLKPPVRYKRAEVIVLRDDSFKYVILFSGGSNNSLRFSYREFKNDFIRAAFTENLEVPREPFPQMIRLKDLQLEILGLTGMGLRYRLVETPTS